MDTDKRPRAHQKKESGQSVNVNKTDKVETGHGPVGSGGRPQQSAPSFNGSNKAYNQRTGRSAQRSLFGGSRLLPIILVVAAVVLLSRNCGSGSQRYFWRDCPSPTPSHPPEPIA